MSSLTVNSSQNNSALGAAVQQVNSNQQVNQQDFLQLLSTELANQDPTQPQDQTQLLAELAQFSTVQGVTQVATGQSQMQAANLLGHSVTALINQNNSPQQITGKVTSINWSGSQVNLTLDNGNSVPLTNVTQVSQ